MKRKGQDDQKRRFQTIDQVHILSGDGRRGGDTMIRRKVFKQLTKFTYLLETDEEESDEWYSNN
jgi:hypothetical protein